MAVVMNEEKRYRMQNVGFGVATKLTFTAASNVVLVDQPIDKVILQVQTSTGTAPNSVAESGPALTVGFAAPYTGVVYVNAVGI